MNNYLNYIKLINNKFYSFLLIKKHRNIILIIFFTFTVASEIFPILGNKLLVGYLNKNKIQIGSINGNFFNSEIIDLNYSGYNVDRVLISMNILPMLYGSFGAFFELVDDNYLAKGKLKKYDNNSLQISELKASLSGELDLKLSKISLSYDLVADESLIINKAGCLSGSGHLFVKQLQTSSLKTLFDKLNFLGKFECKDYKIYLKFFGQGPSKTNHFTIETVLNKKIIKNKVKIDNQFLQNNMQVSDENLTVLGFVKNNENLWVGDFSASN